MVSEYPMRKDVVLAAVLLPATIRTPGKWYIKFVHTVPVQGDSVNYESTWTTLTFQVR